MKQQTHLITPDQIVEHIRNAFQSLDMRQIMNCFSDDVEVLYNDLPAIHGKHSLENFLSASYQGMSDYQLSKNLRAVRNNELVIEVSAKFKKQKKYWESRILEILTLDQEQIIRWEYVGVISERTV